MEYLPDNLPISVASTPLAFCAVTAPRPAIRVKNAPARRDVSSVTW